MQIQKNKYSKIFTITLIMILSISGIAAILSTVVAHDPPWNIPTYAYVGTSPGTVGVGQYTQIVFWLDKLPPTAGGSGGDLWRGHMIDITKPDGSKEQLGPFMSGAVGSGYTTYTPDQVGDYTIVHIWPGQVLARGNEPPNPAGLDWVGDFFEGSTSDPVILTVTEESIDSWLESPLPDYWERPIPTANRDWVQLTSNWIRGSWLRYDKFQENGQAPNSAHVLYALPIVHGGIADPYYGPEKLDTTDYETPFTDPIVMAGKIYYSAGTHPNYGYYCVDLKTGKLDWFKNGTDNGLNNPVIMRSMAGGGGAAPSVTQSFPQLDFGQLFHYKSPNGEGVKDYLWMTLGSNWYMLDANTGNWILTLENVPGGETITDQSGSIIRYSYDEETGQFLGWNLTQAIPPAGPTGSAEWQWEPMVGATIDAVNNTIWTEYGPDPRNRWFADDVLPRTGHSMNLTGPTDIPGGMSVIQDENRVPRLFFFDDFPGASRFGTTEDFFNIAVVRINENAVPYSPFPDKPGSQNWNLGYDVTLLWNKQIPYQRAGNLTWNLGPISYEDKVFTLWAKQTREWYGYSLNDGSLLWGPTESTPGWDMYGVGGFYAYGNLYAGGYGGLLACYDIKTGNRTWTYTLDGIGYENAAGDFPIQFGGIADGKIFIFSSEHAPTSPMWRGAYLRAIDAYTGEEVWKSLTYISEENSGQLAIADGCIVAGNGYDNRLYVYGKGPSTTTVTAPDTVVSFGSGVMIRGSVTDQSPGAKGTPAISDESMDSWMDYLYMKQAMPVDAIGVTVKLSTYDPNGNYQDIGATTVDTNGNFGMSWTPEIPGDYYVMAEFEGSESYGSSSATTYVGVSEPPAATLPPEATPAPMTDTYLAGSTIAIIAGIAIAVFLLLRKK